MSITLYTTHCPKCKVIELKLKQKDIKHDICEDVAEMQKLGIISAPALMVDGELLDFNKAVIWINTKWNEVRS